MPRIPERGPCPDTAGKCTGGAVLKSADPVTAAVDEAAQGDSALCHCGLGAKGTQNGNHHQPQFSREFSKKVKDQRSSSLPQLARKHSNPKDQRTANQPQIQGNPWMKKLWPLVRQHSSNPIRQKIPVNSQHLALITQKKVVVQRVQSDGLKR